MPTKKISEEELRRAMRVVVPYVDSPDYSFAGDLSGGVKSAWQAAAESSGYSPSTLKRHVEIAQVRFGWTPENYADDTPGDLGELGDGLEAIKKFAPVNDEYIAKAKRARVRIVPVRPEPFTIFLMGDPHLDNRGANLTQVLQDLETTRAAGMRGIQMGDILDNFHARAKLAAKQADNPMTRQQGLAAARYLVRDSGVNWDGHILGNHDKWLGSQGEHLIREWARGSKVFDWIANIVYQWEGGRFSVLAAHDFKGHSGYNPLHGMFKRALEDGTADLYAAAHRHNAAKGDFENGFRGRHYWHARMKGYKDWDDYANEKGFQQQEYGHSAAAVINPLAENRTNLCTMFLNVADGAEYCESLKRRLAA